MIGNRGAVLAACVLVAGCAPAGRYLAARGLDLADVVQLNAGYGPGALASAKATDFAHLAAGWSRDRKAGIVGRHAARWDEENLGFPVSNVAEFYYAPRWRLASALLCFQAREVGPFATGDREFLWNRLDSRCGRTEAPWLDRFDLEAGGTALFVNARAGLRPGQAADFVLGLFTLDPAGDDDPEGAPGGIVSRPRRPAP